jgi:hypothetical protein
MRNRWASVLLAVLALLAGCSDSTPGEAGNGPGAGEALLGTIQGVVVSQAIAPLADAAVAVEPGGQATKTDVDGAFRFAGLAPGSYTLRVALAGYLEQAVAVATGSGLVQVVLPPDVGAVRYVEAFAHDGFVDTSVNVGGARSSSNNAPNFTFDGTRLPDAIQVEMAWTSTQALGSRMDLTLIADNGGTVVPDVGHVQGESPISVRLDQAAIQAAGFGPGVKLDIAVFVGEQPMAADRGVGVAAQQRFTLFTHMFYGYAPPDAWRFSVDGEAPPPTE